MANKKLKQNSVALTDETKSVSVTNMEVLNIKDVVNSDEKSGIKSEVDSLDLGLIEKETIKEVKKPTSKIDYIGRGFKSLKEAQDFINTAYFKGLGKEDQEEYKNWLKN